MALPKIDVCFNCVENRIVLKPDLSVWRYREILLHLSSRGSQRIEYNENRIQLAYYTRQSLPLSIGSPLQEPKGHAAVGRAQPFHPTPPLDNDVVSNYWPTAPAGILRSAGRTQHKLTCRKKVEILGNTVRVRIPLQTTKSTNDIVYR